MIDTDWLVGFLKSSWSYVFGKSSVRPVWVYRPGCVQPSVCTCVNCPVSRYGKHVKHQLSGPEPDAAAGLHLLLLHICPFFSSALLFSPLFPLITSSSSSLWNVSLGLLPPICWDLSFVQLLPLLAWLKWCAMCVWNQSCVHIYVCVCVCSPLHCGADLGSVQAEDMLPVALFL